MSATIEMADEWATCRCGILLPCVYHEEGEKEKDMDELLSKLQVVTFTDGFSLMRGDLYWIGSDGCEYDDPIDYLNNGSPVMEELKRNVAALNESAAN